MHCCIIGKSVRHRILWYIFCCYDFEDCKKLKKVEKNYHFIFEALKLMRRMILYSMFNLRFCQRSNLFDQKRYMYIVDSAYDQLIS